MKCGSSLKMKGGKGKLHRIASSVSYRRKRAALGTMRCSSMRRSGLSTLRCDSWRRSGTGASRCVSKSGSGSCTLKEGEMEIRRKQPAGCDQGEGSNEVPTYMELISQAMWVAKMKVNEEFNKLTIAEMMGREGQKVLFAWTYALIQVLDASPEMLQMKQAKDDCFGMRPLMDFIANEACGMAFGWSRFFGYMQKKHMVAFIEEEKMMKEQAGQCDPLMHDQLRGGMINQSDEEVLRAFRCMHNHNEADEAMRDWTVNKRTKPNSSAGFNEENGPVGGGEGKVEAKNSGGSIKTVGQACGILRGGGFGNRFAPLAVADEQEDDCSEDHQSDEWIVVQRTKKGKSFYDKVKINMNAVQNRSGCHSDTSGMRSSSDDEDSEDGANTAALGNMEDMTRDSCGQEEEKLRGGALGSSTTQKKKQVAEAVQQMEGILRNLQTQTDQDEAEGIISDMKKMVKAWEDKKPQKDEMKKQMEEMINKLKASGDGGSTPAPNSGTSQPSRRQSFYAEFHQKAVEKVEERMQQNSKGKGKGKSKSKTKSKDGKDAGTLPKYDLRQAFPNKSVNSWISVMKDVEVGKEPTGAVTVCPDMKTAAEIQALSKVHELKTGILLITKNTGGEDIKLTGARTTLLPYQGNLALVEAVLAMSTGATPNDCGMTPVKANNVERKRKKENAVTLRIMVVKGLLSHQDMERMKTEPTYALHLMECGKMLEELKTSGWSEQTEVFVGYIEAEKSESEMLLNLSGQGGVFISHLRKDVIEWPNVTWRLPEGNESMQLYHLRILKIARELGKPLAFRRGGGAAFGVVMPAADDDEHIHSWSLSGAPPSWGPVTLREWLEKQGWAVMDTTQPRKRHLPWSFRGRMAGKPNDRSFSYEVEGEESNNFYVLVKRWEKRRQPDESTPIAGAGQRWWHKSATFDPIEEDLTATWPDGAEEAPQPTIMDATAEDADGDDNMNGNKREQNAEKPQNGTSPPKKKSDESKIALYIANHMKPGYRPPIDPKRFYR